MASLAELVAWRDKLFRTRLNGLRELHDSNGERIAYKSDAEMARALAAADAAIAAAIRRPSSTILFRTSKGLDR